MEVYEDMLQLIGNTPMVKINHFTENDNINIFAKLELLNPSGSVKDRIGY